MSQTSSPRTGGDEQTALPSITSFLEPLHTSPQMVTQATQTPTDPAPPRPAPQCGNCQKILQKAAENERNNFQETGEGQLLPASLIRTSILRRWAMEAGEPLRSFRKGFLHIRAMTPLDVRRERGVQPGSPLNDILERRECHVVKKALFHHGILGNPKHTIRLQHLRGMAEIWEQHYQKQLPIRSLRPQPLTHSEVLPLPEFSSGGNGGQEVPDNHYASTCPPFVTLCSLTADVEYNVQEDQLTLDPQSLHVGPLYLVEDLCEDALFPTVERYNITPPPEEDSDDQLADEPVFEPPPPPPHTPPVLDDPPVAMISPTPRENTSPTPPEESMIAIAAAVAGIHTDARVSGVLPPPPTLATSVNLVAVHTQPIPSTTPL